MAKSKKKENDKLIIGLIVGVLILIVLIIGMIFIYNWGKGNGYSQYQNEHNADIQELDNKEKSLQTWASDLSRREGELNNSEQTISNCFTNLQNATEELVQCNQKLDSPDYYVFDLNYSYNEINMVLLMVMFYFPISLALNFTLFKFIIDNKKIRAVWNLLAIIIFIAVIISMGVN